MPYVSRAGEKLAYALREFTISVRGFVCADFGSSTGGFVDCLLEHGAEKIYAVETGYGVLDWKLRNDKRVVVLERKNAMHIELPEQVDLITIDTSWTKIEKILPNALKNLKPDGRIVALIKPHYEAEPNMLRKGRVADDFMADILEKVRNRVQKAGAEVIGEIESPLRGEKGKNKEYLFCVKNKLY